MVDQFTIAQAARFLGWALLVNRIGGSTFVAVLNYAQVRTAQVNKQP